MKNSEKFNDQVQSAQIYPPQLESYIFDGVLTLPDDLRHYPHGIKIENCGELKSLGNILSIRGATEIYGCPNLESFGDLEIIHGGIEVSDCPKLENVSNLKRVSGRYIFRNTPQSEKPQNLEITKIAGLPVFIIFKPA